jgi:signal recognition particle subunit SRP54
MFGGLPGMGGLARNVRRAMKSGKMPEGFPPMPGGMPGFPGMGMPGMGLPGMGLPGMPSMSGARPATPAMRALSASERNAKKNQRKRERDARKKGKKK